LINNNSKTGKELFTHIAGGNEPTFLECVHRFTLNCIPIEKVLFMLIPGRGFTAVAFIKFWKGGKKLLEIEQ